MTCRTARTNRPIRGSAEQFATYRLTFANHIPPPASNPSERKGLAAVVCRSGLCWPYGRCRMDQNRQRLLIAAAAAIALGAAAYAVFFAPAAPPPQGATGDTQLVVPQRSTSAPAAPGGKQTPPKGTATASSIPGKDRQNPADAPLHGKDRETRPKPVRVKDKRQIAG